MKDFDLDAAKRGATVCTRGGAPVRILSFDCRKKRKGNVLCPIVAEVFFKDDWEFKDGNWATSDYDQSGRFHGIGTTSEYDLMMSDDDYLEKLERGKYDHFEDNLEMVGKTDHIGKPTEKVGWDYWRRMYAGMAMQGLMADYNHNCDDMTEDAVFAAFVARRSVFVADALIDRLKKTQK